MLTHYLHTDVSVVVTARLIFCTAVTPFLADKCSAQRQFKDDPTCKRSCYDSSGILGWKNAPLWERRAEQVALMPGKGKP